MQPRVGDLWEVMVLIVEADIVGQAVQRAVVRVRLLALHPARCCISFHIHFLKLLE